MMPPHLRPVLRRLEAALRERFGERYVELRLFGSYARGEANEDSDVDVLVQIRDLEPHEIAEVSDLATPIALETGVMLAVLPMASQRFAQMLIEGRGIAVELERTGERL